MGNQAIIDDFTDKDEVSSSRNLWDYKEETEIVGIVKEISNGNFNGKTIGLLTNAGEELVYLPELTALNSKLKDVAIEDKVKVVYEGEEKGKKSGRMYAVFKVSIKHQ
jgi:hypothetical protein